MTVYRSKGTLILIMAIFFTVALIGMQASANSDAYGARGALSDSNLDLFEMLTYAIQDEYLAKAEYELIMEKYGSIRPFINIVTSEEQHVQQLTRLFETYGFELPTDTARDHVVLPTDLKKAFETGIQAEIDNIAMYAAFLGRELPADVRDVFSKLKNASENHLRAFQNNLSRYNETEMEGK